MHNQDNTIESAEFEIVDDEIKTALAGVDTDTATALRKDFEAFFAKAREWQKEAAGIVITDATQVSLMKKARELRLEVKKVRCTVEDRRKALKEDSLRRGKAIDGLANLVKGVLEPIEAHLIEQEQYAIRKEAERVAALEKARSDEISPFVRPGEAPPALLGALSESQYADVLAGAKSRHAQREAEEKAARAAAEEKAKAEREERDRLKAEAEKARKEKEAAEESARTEREKLLAEQRAKDEAARKEREAIETKAKAEREKAEAEARTAREAQEKAEREASELREKQAREAKRLADEQAAKAAAELAAKKAAAAAPDREKVRAFAAKVKAIEFPQLSTDEGRALSGTIVEQHEKYLAWLERRAASLGNSEGKAS